MSKYNVNESTEGQSDYCERKDAPHFAPRSGDCWNCRKNIYKQYHWIFEGGMKKTHVPKEASEHSTGITTKQASESLVTGCPHCNRSYCD